MCFKKIDTAIEPLRKFARCIGTPLWLLAARIYVAQAFFKSGMTRYKDWANGNFDNQIFLFELEHPVPGLPPEFAAYSATAGELILPVMLILGLFGRFAAAGLFIMAAIIQITYVHSAEHVLWMFLSAAIVIIGPGLISLDQLIVKFIRKP